MTTTPTTRATLFLGATAAVAATALGALGFAQHPDAEQNHGTITASSAQSVDRLEEDEVGWDCATMGNRVCGPVAPPCAIDQTFTWDGYTLTPAPALTNECQRVDILYPVR